MDRKVNGHHTSPSTPASYYYSDGEIHAPAPEDVAEKLRRVGSLPTAADRVADLIAQEATDRRQMIGGVDNFWLLLSDITDFNPACTSVSILRDSVTVEDVAEQLLRQSEKFPRFRQKLESVGRLFRGPIFVDDPDFDVFDHVHVRRLPEPAGKRELDALVGEFIAEEWDLSRPLWDTLLVENYRGEDGACAIVAKGHHTLSDGQGFVMSQLYLTSFFDDLAQMMNGAADKLSKVKRGLLLPSEYSRYLKPFDPYASNYLLAPFLQLFLTLLYWLFFVARSVFSLSWSTYQGLRMVAYLLFTWWRVEMVTADQPSKRTPHREFSSSRVFSLQDVKACQQAFSGPRPGYAVAGVPKHQRNVRSRKGHVTLNDVICAVMADVLGDVIASKPEPRTAWGKFRRTVNKFLPAPMGFFIPISIRQPGDWSMRNLSTGSNVYLSPSRDLTSDISVHEIHAHIHRCRYELSLFKHSEWPKLCFHVLQLSGQAPIFLPLSWFSKSRERGNPLVKLLRRGVMKPFVDACSESFTAVLTNIPGPSKGPITWSGVEVTKWSAIPPQAGAGTMGIGIMSYAGGISIAVSADLVPDSEGVTRKICEGFERRFELYVARAKAVLEHQD
ncbi:wax ester synthase-like acyl-CoA acyltransferase domain-containing protein [Ganoderma leucocontextum]|nr:wax ester synthase-like acyl-CoA acyltransferase domain-containing protein [Ganoderma leucocontextum]